MRRITILGTVVVAVAVAVAGCSGSTAGRPEAGAPSSSSLASGGPTTTPAVSSGAASGSGTVVDATTVEQNVLRPMQSESDAFWEEILGLAGSQATVSAAMTFLAGDETFDCGGVQLSGRDQYGPTYCAPEDRIVVSQAYLSALAESGAVRADGSFADPAVEVGTYFLLAHQWGHDIVGELVEAKGGVDLTFVPSTEIELVADCFAGLMIAGVPRVFTDKEPADILGQVPTVGERFAGIQASPPAREKAVAQGLGIDYDQRQQFVAGIDQCLSTQAPQLSQALA